MDNKPRAFCWRQLKVVAGTLGLTIWLGLHLYLLGLPQITDAMGAVAAFLLPWFAVQFVHSVVLREKERRS